MIKVCLRCKINKKDTEYYNVPYGEWTRNICKKCRVKESSPVHPEEWYAGINYQQERAKKYFRAKRSNDNPSMQ